MKTCFHIKKHQWKIKWPGRVSKHDLVYLSPPTDPLHGIALGNGDVGVLTWCEPSRIVMAINKCDLWDESSLTQFTNWKSEEEELTSTLRHACRINIDFKFPVFDYSYLSDFKGKLHLADASLSISAKSPFGSISFKAFLDYEQGILICEINNKLKEKANIEILLERFGSRTFAHWFRLINRNPSIGLNGTSSCCDKDGIYIQHKLKKKMFTVGCCVLSESNKCISYQRETSHVAKVIVSPPENTSFKLAAIVTSPSKTSQTGCVKKVFSELTRQGTSILCKKHKKQWKDFWLCSLMESGNDYLDNMWHLTMYYANSCQGGPYPGRFSNGLWSWNRDVQQWNYYFHWNQQQLYWPLNAAGHHDLIDSYLIYRFKTLPQSIKDAKELFGVQGAFVSDVTDFRGLNSRNELENHTPVAQIAMDFWKQYKYTGDKKFLREQVVPYIVNAALFFESLFIKEADGKYHARKGTGYEGWIYLKDSITELACAKALFSAASIALKETHLSHPNERKWKQICDNLTDFHVIKADESMISKQVGRYYFNRGAYKGDRAFSEKIFAAGFGVKEKKYLTSFIPNKIVAQKGQELLYDKIVQFENALPPIDKGALPIEREDDIKSYGGIFPAVEYAGIFPSGIIGLKDRGKDVFKTAVNTAKLYGSCNMGWDIFPVVLARLGLAKELTKFLSYWPGQWQFYANGFTHCGPQVQSKIESSMPYAKYMVADSSLAAGRQQFSPENMIPFNSWPFRYTSLEWLSVLSCAMNEALLQSYEGTIRIASAVSCDQNSRFTLHAVNGFIVSVEIVKGKPLWISIKSTQGKTCRLYNPWPEAFVFECVDKKPESFKGKVITFETECNKAYFVIPDKEILKKWQTIPLVYSKNNDIKTSPCGMAKLGIERLF